MAVAGRDVQTPSENTGSRLERQIGKARPREPASYCENAASGKSCHRLIFQPSGPFASQPS